MRALDKKRWRDLWALRGPASAIALVLACGVVTFVASAGMIDSLEATRASFYREYRFADVFASVRRAPESLRREVEALPGVLAVETRVEAVAPVTVPGFDEPVTGYFVSLPDEGPPLLNRLYLGAGRLPAPSRIDEVVLGDAFAEAHGLGLGDVVSAVLNGRRRTLTVVGLARSPEFVYQLPPGGLFPDFERFGILWMRRAPLAAAYDLAGAFSGLTLVLAPGAREAAVIERLDPLLEAYGGTGAYGRADQASHQYLDEELRQLAQSATLLPAIFLAVAAFLLAVVVGRLVQTERETIATLKAFGYGTAAVAGHYVQLVLVIVLAGSAVGVALGLWAAQALGRLYLDFYRFPELVFLMRPATPLAAVGIGTAAALAATLRAVWRASALPPAVAMRPPAPHRFRVSLVERLGIGRWLSAQSRMVVRHLGRHPGRALGSAFGIAMACALVLLGRFMGDAVDLLIEVQFERAYRQDLQLTFTAPTDAAVMLELARLPGVRYAEPQRGVGAEVRFGRHTRDVGLIGMPPRGDLARVLGADLKPVRLAPEGLVLSAFLADRLGAHVGDTVHVTVRDAARPDHDVPVVQVVEEFAGAGAYMDRRALNRLLGEGDLVSGALLAVDEALLPALYKALRERPVVLQATALQQARRGLEETIAENLLIFTSFLVAFAVALAFGVLYNTARLSLAERARELASLRVLGFTRGEIGHLFFGELALLTVGALPPGLAIGAAFSFGYARALQSDIVQFPFVLYPASYAFAAAVVLAAAVGAALAVRRRLNRLDLIAVLKTRE